MTDATRSRPAPVPAVPGRAAGASPGTLRELFRGPLPWLAFLGLFALSYPADLVTYSLLARAEGEAGWLSLGLLAAAVDAASWAALAPLALSVAWLLPMDRRRWRGAAAVILAVGMAAPALRLAAATEVFFRAGWTDARRTGWELLSLSLGSGMMVTAALIGAGYGVRYALRDRERALALSRREAQLAEARFRAVKGRLEPRFLFAALDSVSALTLRDAREADRLLLRLSEVLRATFAGTPSDEVTLESEVGFSLLYLGVERTCSGTRPVELSTSMTLPAQSALVPHRAVFPLIEQAWREAGESPAGPAVVRVVARELGNTLVVEVRDTGRATAAERRGRPGWEDVRLVNALVERRLAGAQGWTLADLAAGGVAATLRIPLRVAEGGR